jgi:hypothetical protein
MASGRRAHPLGPADVLTRLRPTKPGAIAPRFVSLSRVQSGIRHLDREEWIRAENSPQLPIAVPMISHRSRDATGRRAPRELSKSTGGTP